MGVERGPETGGVKWRGSGRKIIRGLHNGEGQPRFGKVHHNGQYLLWHLLTRQLLDGVNGALFVCVNQVNKMLV